MIDLPARLWRTTSGRWQWYLLWLLQRKFIVGVSGVLFDDQGRILLLRHRYWRQGSWGLPGGWVRAGETLEQALLREVREETGYAATIEGLLRLASGHRLRLEVSFRGRLARGELRLSSHEVLEAAFFAPSDLPDGVTGASRELIALALRES
jgi:8-oxo-dGTP diphosphatase